MQLIKNGPNIPPEVLGALEDGDLIFFCGAGVSYPAGLPSYEGLVERVYAKLKLDMASPERQAFSAGQYDRALGLLEDRLSSSSLVRETVIEILQAGLDLSKVATHDALLTLAKDKQGSYRIVTTNFDRGFAVLSRPDLAINAAPMLPVPKRYRWNCLVHLHGLIDSGDPQGRNLVLTSADFGAAYLTERWASRFVTELFRRFKVIFVGYSVEDPVIRYMMDALAADRRLGDEQVQKAYVLAPYKGRGRAVAASEWEAKHVQPILYNKKFDHALLHRTLKAWSELHRDGLMGKEALVIKHSRVPPKKPYDEAVEQVVWAISEKSGHIASLFARLNPVPPIEWLEVLDEYGLLKLPDISKPPDSFVPLVDHGHRATAPAPLHPVTRSLGRWMCQHLEREELLVWVIHSGGCFHPELREMIRDRINGSTLPTPIKVIWGILASESLACSCSQRFSRTDLFDSLRECREWSSLIKREILEAFTPCVKFGLPWRSPDWEAEQAEPEEREAAPANREARVSDFVHAELELRMSDSIDLIRPAFPKILKLAHAPRGLADILTTALSDAWELLALIEKIDEQADHSYIFLPSITDHPQNRAYESWAKLVLLLRDSWSEFKTEDSEASRVVVERWRSLKYPIFRRLTMYAMTDLDIFSATEGLNFLLAENAWWMWSVETQRESYRLLAAISTAITDEEDARLTAAILNGPPRSMFRKDLDQEEWSHLVDREIWLHLAKLESFGRALPVVAKQKLEQLSLAHPMWHLQENEKDEFPYWMESGSGYITEHTVDELTSLEEKELLHLLISTEKNREGLLDLLREIARKDPHRIISLLVKMSEENQWVEDIWHSSLNGLVAAEPSTVVTTTWIALGSVIAKAPADFLQVALYPLCWWFRAATKDLGADEQEDLYWVVWDLLIGPAANASPGDFADDPVPKALNSPAGILTESLLYRLWARKPPVGGGLPREIESRLTILTQGRDVSFVFCRIILASRLHVLFAIDRTWTEAHLLPYFKWSTSAEAPFLWEGYLWAPRISPDLLAHLKPDLKTAVLRSGKLGKHSKQVVHLFAAASLEFPDAFSRQEVRRVLKQLDGRGRSEIADWIWRRLQESAATADVYWTNRVEPWLDAVWPKDLAAVESGTAKALALAAISAGAAFERAVDCVIKYLKRIDDFGFLVRKIESSRVRERQLAQIYPSAALRLLDAIISEEGRWPDESLRKVLTDIIEGDPSLKDDPRYRRLNEFLRKRNL